MIDAGPTRDHIGFGAFERRRWTIAAHRLAASRRGTGGTAFRRLALGLDDLAALFRRRPGVPSGAILWGRGHGTGRHHAETRRGWRRRRPPRLRQAHASACQTHGDGTEERSPHGPTPLKTVSRAMIAQIAQPARRKPRLTEAGPYLQGHIRQSTPGVFGKSA